MFMCNLLMVAPSASGILTEDRISGIMEFKDWD
jgi:hypothetical protein